MIEMFTKIANHQITGLMFHEQMSSAFGWLGLKGYKCMHKYHFIKEMLEFYHTNEYSVSHFGKMLRIKTGETKFIDSAWYGYTTKDVTNGVRKTFIKESFEKWLSWEKETKTLYNEAYKFFSDNQMAEILPEIEHLLKDVEQEIKYIEKQLIDFNTLDYDLKEILVEQRYLKEYYKEKIKTEFN